MDLLTLGLIFFFVLHCIPFFPGTRNGLCNKLGHKVYHRGFSLASLAALIAIGFGYAGAPYEALWSFPRWGDTLALYAMAPAFIFIAAGNLKTHLRKVLRHPMSVGFFIWGASHVYATGDLANVKLFGAFAVYSLVAIISAELRGKVPAHKPEAREDLKAVVIGLAVYAVFFFAHGWLFGAPLT